MQGHSVQFNWEFYTQFYVSLYMLDCWHWNSEYRDSVLIPLCIAKAWKQLEKKATNFQQLTWCPILAAMPRGPPCMASMKLVNRSLFRRLTSSSAWSRRARTWFFSFIEKFITFEIIQQMKVNLNIINLPYNSKSILFLNKPNYLSKLNKFEMILIKCVYVQF